MSQPLGRGRGRAAAQSSKFQKEPSTASSSAQSDKGRAHGTARGRPVGGGGDAGERGGKTDKGMESAAVTRKLETMTLSEREDDKAPERGGGNGNGNGDGDGDGNGNGNPAVGRGGVRGSRQGIADLIRTRPEICASKKGSSGTPIHLLTNYFRLEAVSTWVIYQYRVDFNVDEERVEMKKKWLREHVNVVGAAYLFDGSSLFTSRRLNQDNKPINVTSVRESDNFVVQIEIRLVQEVNIGNSVYFQVFSILLRRSQAHLKLQLVNRNYFDAAAAIKLTNYNMEVWPGYITSIRQNENDVLMCTEITHKIMRMDTALDLLGECIKQRGDHRLSFQQAVIGEIVLTDYNNKTYRVDDVDFSTNPSSKFKLQDGTEISYIEYYRSRYNIRIKDPRQPLLVSRSNARYIRAGMPKHCLLIPELCRMTGLTSRMLENFQLKKGLSEYTRLNPSERMRRLLKFNERLNSKPEILQEFSQWGLRLGKELVGVPARELPPEIIVGGGGQSYSAGSEADWTRELRGRPMLRNVRMRDWAVICPRQLKPDLFPFLDALRKAGAGMDFYLPQPKIFETVADKPVHLVEAVEEALARSQPDLLMFICPNDRGDRYNAIKKKCTVDRGVPSQVVLSRSLRSKGLSVATKIAIQLNCKVGGCPWSVEVPLKSVMVIGFDVFHDTHSKVKSYGAMVASLNSSLSSWFSAVSHHSSGEELSNSLSLDVCKALRKYVEVNGALPGRIFVYRDGVGEGQIAYVYEHEVVMLKKRLTEIYGGPTWKLCYIIVSKRINTRLFKDGRNPVAGTVVDDVITLPERYDFYLISQNVNHGTVTPTNYNVISDNVGLKPDQIQRWTYKMTHLYYNWSGTVRVPAPCQYAHKLAFLVGQSLHIQPHPYLESTLHFL